MVKISVIVPVYNVEDYLKESLDSILNQTIINDIEVIIVDDGSTDDSGRIVDDYASQYDNFHVYHKTNEGQAIARNYGLEFAQGEYVHFMDADDYMPPKAYETLYNFNSDNDFVVGNVLKFGEYNIWENVLFKKAFSEFKNNVKSFNLNDFPYVLWDTVIWNKLYKRAFLEKNNLRFIEKNTYYEDLIFSLQSYVLADSIGFSSEIFYFWRLRFDKSSITQKTDDIKNFNDRIFILNVYNSLMDYYGFSDEFKRIVYDKWLKHDLRTSIKKIGNYPGKYYSKLIEDTNEILNIIPDDLKDNLNSYLKVLYKMVENNDIISLLSYAHLEDNIKRNPNLFSNFDEDYLKLVNLDCEGDNRGFEVQVSNVFYEDNKIYLEFVENLEFIPNSFPHEISAFLLHNNKEYPLMLNNNKIIIPLNLTDDLKHLKIKFIYSSSVFNKTTLLKNYNRKSIKTAKYDIDLGIGINNICYLDIIKRKDNQIIIKEIKLDGGEFIFECESLNKVNYLTLINFVTNRQSKHQVINIENSNSFIFKIPIKKFDLAVIKKWEINCDESFNSIKVLKTFKFIFKNSKIVFKNKRNKIYIYHKIINPHDKELEKLRSKNKKLTKKVNKLKKENNYLNKTLDEFKSRKIVRFVDKLKR